MFGSLLSRQRIDRRRLVEPDPLVELPRQRRVEVVARKLRVWAVDDADRALEPLREQRSRASAINATTYGCEIVCSASIGSGVSGPRSKRILSPRFTAVCR